MDLNLSIETTYRFYFWRGRIVSVIGVVAVFAALSIRSTDYGLAVTIAWIGALSNIIGILDVFGIFHGKKAKQIISEYENAKREKHKSKNPWE